MLLEQLEECSRAVEKAERYEMQLEIYRLILPTYEKQRDYVSLAECFSVLSQACSRANEVNRTGKRLLGTYYRVALYGKVFQVNSFVFITVNVSFNVFALCVYIFRRDSETKPVPSTSIKNQKLQICQKSPNV